MIISEMVVSNAKVLIFLEVTKNLQRDFDLYAGFYLFFQATWFVNSLVTMGIFNDYTLQNDL